MAANRYGFDMEFRTLVGVRGKERKRKRGSGGCCRPAEVLGGPLRLLEHRQRRGEGEREKERKIEPP